MLIGKDNVQNLIRAAKPRVIWIKSGHLKSPGATIREIIKETSSDASQEFDTYLALLGPGQYSIQYMWCDGEEKSGDKAPTRQHAYGDSFDIPNTGYQQQHQQSFQQNFPASVGNPYATGERTYTKAEMLEIVEDKVEKEMAKREIQHMKEDFARQIKEAKEDNSGGAIGKMIEGIMPHLPQLLAGNGARPAVGSAIHQTPPVEVHQPDYTHPTDDYNGWDSPEQGARYDVATQQFLALCEGDKELFVTRLEKLVNLAQRPGMLSMLDNA